MSEHEIILVSVFFIAQMILNISVFVEIKYIKENQKNIAGRQDLINQQIKQIKKDQNRR